jgi:hypothetical protein
MAKICRCTDGMLIPHPYPAPSRAGTSADRTEFRRGTGNRRLMPGGSEVGLSEVRLAEHAAVDLAHAEFEVHPVTGFVEIGDLAILHGGDTESAGDLADLVKHCVFFLSYIAPQQYRMRGRVSPTLQTVVRIARNAGRIHKYQLAEAYEGLAKLNIKLADRFYLDAGNSSLLTNRTHLLTSPRTTL